MRKILHEIEKLVNKGLNQKSQLLFITKRPNELKSIIIYNKKA